ncbi:LysR family transcriptional regulator [Alteribacter keqinensis]|uniref:LysR family transcriptional regulator n=1 Tax=Alteribacter keqinensis TaxID=2483800 RepID=A0A3M7TR32_9BACI|nr:LysR family transcriptional regulator [Alteribacter keqinensis]RNA67639.1 LysR family transcriptional regulator [Alteribacter keqinensis]
MNLQALRYFVEVAHCLNFSKAAKNLHISQPALSQQITMLEEHFNFKLLIRNTRSVTLTKEGAFLYENLQPSFENIESTLHRIEKTGAIPQRTIRIATIPSAASNWIPPLLHKLRERFDDLEFHIQETSSKHVVDLVKGRDYDIGFFRMPAHIRRKTENQLMIRELTSHSVKLVVSAAHPLARLQSINLYEARNETFLHYDPDTSSSLHTTLEQACRTAGFIPKTMGIGPELLTIANLIANDIGVTLMPTDMIDLLPSHQIRGIDVKNQDLSSTISIVWKQSTSIPEITFHALNLLEDLSTRVQRT